MQVRPLRFSIPCAAAVAVVALAASLPAQAQDYPTKPVTFITPAAAGNSPDVVTRVVADRLTQIWKQQIVVLNKKLVLITPNGANVDTPTTLEPLGGGRFRVVAPTGGGPVGEVVHFAEEAGKPMRLYVGDGYYDRVR